jgi:YebC/PmpR family DNA-binding regulatory protein
MSGHSKWSTIKRKKGAEDAKRGKIFTRVGREIMIAARDGGGDPGSNPKLYLALQKAKAANMPKENVDRAIKKGTGELEGGIMEEITYEGYGIDGVAFIIETLTDNTNRTLSDVRSTFTKNGGRMATSGSVSWQFSQKGFFALKDSGYDFDEVFMVAAEAGADDVVDEDGTIVIYSPREAFAAVEKALLDAKYEIEEGELRWIAQNETELPAEKAIQNMKLMRKLEDLDDVQTVASNLAMTDEVLEAFEAE